MRGYAEGNGQALGVLALRVPAALVRWRRMALLELHAAGVGVRHPRRPESTACGIIATNPADTGVEVVRCRQDSASKSKPDLDGYDRPTYSSCTGSP